MRKITYLAYMILISFSMLFWSCASKPKFTGKGDLCGLIVDEKNKPVSDFVVYCTACEPNLQIVKPVITNESGLFVFFDVPAGSYHLSGSKNNSILEIRSAN